MDRKPDFVYHQEVLSTGMLLEYYSAFRWKSNDDPTLELIVQLVADSLESQIMLGMDAARSSYWRTYGGTPGLSLLLVDFRSQLLQRGLIDKQIAAIFVANPKRAYSFSVQGPSDFSGVRTWHA